MAGAFGRLQARLGTGGVVIGGIIALALAFILFNVLQSAAPATVMTEAGSKFTCTVISVYDGDGPINCSEVDDRNNPVSVRLRGIEAREADNRCRYPDLCPSASGDEAKAALTRIAVGRLECVSFGPSYKNVDARCSTPTGADVSCEMMRSGTVVRWPQYDPKGELLACMPPRR